MTIIEGNKILAEFLGYKYYPKIDGEKYPGWRWLIYHGKSANSYLGRTHKDLDFHCNWDHLMRVVEKIEPMYDEFHGYFAVYIYSNHCTIQGTNLNASPENYHPAYYNESTLKSKIDSVWEQCVYFVMFYNENLKK